MLYSFEYPQLATWKFISVRVREIARDARVLQKPARHMAAAHREAQRLQGEAEIALAEAESLKLQASGHADGRGHRRSRSTGMQATSAPGPLASELHPRCQSESLPPPSPPICIPAAPSRAGPRACGRGHRGDPARPEHRRRANPAGPPGRLPSSMLPI